MYREKGIPLSDKRHPIKQLEKWRSEEALRGVAGGTNVPLLGAVVFAVQMLELGKTTGPEVNIRFKITALGSTDWVGWIIGGQACDCPEKGGLGLVPGPYSSYLTALAIQMSRVEEARGVAPDSRYAVRTSVLDSDDASESG